MKEEKNENIIDINGKFIFKILLLICILIILTVSIFDSFYIVHAGERGIILRWGNPLPIVITEGLHFKYPIADKIVRMDIKTQKYESSASSASKDLI